MSTPLEVGRRRKRPRLLTGSTPLHTWQMWNCQFLAA